MKNCSHLALSQKSKRCIQKGWWSDIRFQKIVQFSEIKWNSFTFCNQSGWRTKCSFSLGWARGLNIITASQKLTRPMTSHLPAFTPPLPNRRYCRSHVQSCPGLPACLSLNWTWPWGNVQADSRGKSSHSGPAHPTWRRPRLQTGTRKMTNAPHHRSITR